MSVIFILTYLGPIALIGIIAQPIIFRLVSMISTKKLVFWTFNIILISMISVYKYYISSEYFMLKYKLNEKENYLHILAIYWTNLRSFSFFMEYCENKDRKSILYLLSYSLYLPVLFNGPFIFYADFETGIKIKSNFIDRLITIMINCTRFIFWMVFIEFVLHFFYVNATYFQIQVKSTTSSSNS